MTDILIRGMDKPASCDDCPMYTCMHNFDNCPISELPPHGDLIDRDAFDANARKRYCSACDNYNGVKCRACWVDDMLGDVADFETVIPWSKEETE